MNAKLIEIRPPRIGASLVALAAVVHWLFPVPDVGVFSSFWAGSVLASLGFLLMTGAWWQFRRQQVAVCPTHPTTSLITDGLFRVTRNPMYLGMSMMLFGVACYVGTLPFYVAAALYVLILDRLYCRFEEKKLAITFGQAYEDYRIRVRRWL